ncbi:hypothetical protein MUK42_22244 [Musa troglodytarum]|uniref:Protein JASON n=1 Tax=Musa troglodytarum TaxID=320322 RepID=A0A9E7GAN1_9LILI|nr:hypothetical protein MUK42_22244 [Musa troglodytarum]
MGCMFRCFGFKENNDERRSHPVPSSRASTSKIDQDYLVPKRQLGSLFLDEEKDSPPEQVTIPSAKKNGVKDGLYGEFKHEADFLKACGAILQTPVEIKKTSVGTVQAPHEHGVSSSYNSWLPGTSCKTLLWDEKRELSQCSIQMQDFASFSQSNSQRSVDLGVVQNEPAVEPKLDIHNPGISHQYESQTRNCASKCSPFPTPRKVTNEMETPVTVYPANRENVRTGRDTTIQTQYVYPATNAVENLSRWKLLDEDSSEKLQSYDNLDKKTNHSPDTGDKMQQMQLISDPEDSQLSITHSLTSPNDKRRQKDEEVYTDKYVSGKTMNKLEAPSDNRDKTILSLKYPEQVVTSLSQWLKPPIKKDGPHDELHEKSRSGKSSDADRPILGMVAAHWKDEEPEPKLSKRWDGNGIPNSTNKYKEDQKVSWHATPFEERLEKALSDENFIPQRNLHHGKLIELVGEGDLSDTAAS